MTKNYEAAMEKCNIAICAFCEIQADYRSLKIGEAEYLAGRKFYEEAMAEFDVAFAAEAELVEHET